MSPICLANYSYRAARSGWFVACFFVAVFVCAQAVWAVPPKPVKDKGSGKVSNSGKVANSASKKVKPSSVDLERKPHVVQPLSSGPASQVRVQDLPLAKEQATEIAKRQLVTTSVDGTHLLAASPFQVPAGLRPRVDFWKDIYSKYSEYQSVIHHRLYPQAVFTVIDYSSLAHQMSDTALEKERERRFKEVRTEIFDVLKRLAVGDFPRTSLEMNIADAMALVPGGPEKYLQVVKEDLVRSQRGIKEKHAEAIARSGRYLPYIERTFVAEFGLPRELTRLPFVESSFDYTAYSSAGAAGIWQFMPRTGRHYGMHVGKIVDERRDPIKATRGAARYLSDAYRRLGSWPLAVTSYNHGVAGVAKKSRELGTTDIVRLIESPSTRGFGFASANFYPCLLAANEVYNERQVLYPNVVVERPVGFKEFKLTYALTAPHVTKRLGVSVEDLRRANYALSERVWRGQAAIPKGYVLRIPSEVTAQAKLLAVPEVPQVPEAPPVSAVYGGVYYRVRKGDSLTSIAKKYHVTVEELRKLNKMKARGLVVGEQLIVKPPTESRHGPSSVATVDYKVKKGDSLDGLSRKFGVGISHLIEHNPQLRKGLFAGQIIRVPSRKWRACMWKRVSVS